VTTRKEDGKEIRAGEAWRRSSTVEYDERKREDGRQAGRLAEEKRVRMEEGRGEAKGGEARERSVRKHSPRGRTRGEEGGGREADVEVMKTCDHRERRKGRGGEA
jgi:hypothetical protein